MNLSERNKNGLTLIQWLTLAGVEYVKDITQDSVRDWQSGRDPSMVRVERQIWQAHYTMVQRRRNAR